MASDMSQQVAAIARVPGALSAMIEMFFLGVIQPASQWPQVALEMWLTGPRAEFLSLFHCH